MTDPRHALLLLAATLALSAGLARQTTSLRVAAATVPVRFDGRVHGPAWAVADSITDVRQREPVEGVAVSDRTVVKVVRDVAALYVGGRVYDDDPPAVPVQRRALVLPVPPTL